MVNPMTLAQHDIENLISIGKAAIACDTLQDIQHQTLQRLQQTIGAESSIYFDVSRSNEHHPFVSELSFGVPGDAPKTWCKHYQRLDPFVGRLMKDVHSGDGNAVISSEVINHRDYINSEFYNDFLRPQSIYHVLLVAIVKNDKPIGMIGLHRPLHNSPFTQSEIAKVRLIEPFYAAAVEKAKLNDKILQNHMAINALATELPHDNVMILDQELYPIFINNNVGQQLGIYLDLNDPAAVKPYLPPEIKRCCNQWRSLFNSQNRATLPEKINFNLNQDGASINGNVRAYESKGSRAIFVVTLGDNNNKYLQPSNLQKYGLTRREMGIVSLVSTGMTNPEIAKKLFISVRTVQNHLRSIFTKVGVHNRTQLISDLIREN